MQLKSSDKYDPALFISPVWTVSTKNKRNCQICSKQFFAKRSDAKFCSPECRKIGKDMRTKEQREKFLKELKKEKFKKEMDPNVETGSINPYYLTRGDPNINNTTGISPFGG